MAKPEPPPRVRPDVKPADDDTKRISFTLTADGKRIDWSKVRESRRGEVEKLLTDDPIVRSKITPTTVEAPIANRAMTDAIVDVLGQLEAALAVRMYGVTIDEALAVCQFSPSEKTMIGDPLERVINKYGSTLLLKYGDELALTICVLALTRSKLAGVEAFKRAKHNQASNVNREEPGNS